MGLTPAAVKASAGAVEYLPVARVTNLTSTIERLKREGIWTYAADMDGEDYADLDLSGPIALVIGAEGEGVSRRVLESCDRTISVPIRGKLDSLQALVVLDQDQIAQGGCQKLVDDLGNILGVLREMMRCDVLDEAFKNETIIGLTHAELRERSHNPQKFFGVQYMQLPDYTMGRDYALLNQLRAAVRETEVAATEAFRVGNKYTRKDIIEELNRLSSAIHIMMCMYLAGQYR